MFASFSHLIRFYFFRFRDLASGTYPLAVDLPVVGKGLTPKAMKKATYQFIQEDLKLTEQLMAEKELEKKARAVETKRLRQLQAAAQEEQDNDDEETDPESSEEEEENDSDDGSDAEGSDEEVTDQDISENEDDSEGDSEGSEEGDFDSDEDESSLEEEVVAPPTKKGAPSKKVKKNLKCTFVEAILIINVGPW